MRTVHPSVLSLPIPSLDEIIAQDPLVLERSINMTEAAEFCGVNPATMRTLQKRGKGPKFREPDGIKKLVTTPRECLHWLTGKSAQGKKARRRIEGGAS